MKKTAIITKLRAMKIGDTAAFAFGTDKGLHVEKTRTHFFAITGFMTTQRGITPVQVNCVNESIDKAADIIRNGGLS